jgi:hypothetical protein
MIRARNPSTLSLPRRGNFDTRAGRDLLVPMALVRTGLAGTF